MRTRNGAATLKRVGEAAKRRRLELGLRLVDVAEKANLDKGSLSRIENGLIGSRGLGVERLTRLAKALEVAPSYLLP